MRLSADTLSIPDKSSLSGVLCGSEIDRVAVHQHHYFPSQIGHPHTLVLDLSDIPVASPALLHAVFFSALDLRTLFS